MDQNSGAPMMDATNATDSNADFNINIQDQLGVPPAPPIPDFLANEPNMPGVNPGVMADLTNSGPTPITGTPTETEVPMPAVLESSEAMNTETIPETTPEMAPAAPEVGEAGATGINSENAGNEGTNMQFEEVKKQMLQDLYPLMDKIKMQPEQKFKVYKQMIESTGSKDMITSAYEAVKGIGDEAERAEALLFLVEKADS